MDSAACVSPLRIADAPPPQPGALVPSAGAASPTAAVPPPAGSLSELDAPSAGAKWAVGQEVWGARVRDVWRKGGAQRRGDRRAGRRGCTEGRRRGGGMPLLRPPHESSATESESESDGVQSRASLWATASVATRQRGDGTVTTAYRPVSRRAARRGRWLSGLDSGRCDSVPRREREEHAVNTLYWRRFFTIMAAGWDWWASLLLLLVSGLTCYAAFVQNRYFVELVSSLSTNSIAYEYALLYRKEPLPQVPDIGPAFPPNTNASLCSILSTYAPQYDCDKLSDIARHSAWGWGTESRECLQELLPNGKCELAFLCAHLRRNISLKINSRVLGGSDLDNYDQRVTEDVEYLLQMGLGVLIGNYRNFLPGMVDTATTKIIIVFFVCCAGIWVLCYACYIGSMHRVSQIQFNQKWCEGDMRCSAPALRNVAHCESVCLYSGEGRMEVRADRSFANVLLWGFTDFFNSCANPFNITFLYAKTKSAQVLACSTYFGGIVTAVATLMSGYQQSTVLRVAAGLWPPVAGRVTAPSTRPYVFAGTLREQRYDADGDEGSEEEAAVVAALLRRVVRRVDLADVAARWGLDAPVPWPEVLSGGEVQRLSFARLLALDVGLEARMFALLKEEGVAVLSVVDRPSAVACHDQQ
eukprot:gene55718-41502_t